MVHAPGYSEENPTDDMNETADKNGYANQEASEGVVEAGQKPVDEIESLCMNCHENVCAALCLIRG